MSPLSRPISKLIRNFSTEAFKNQIQVCVLGADTPVGCALSPLLKQNPVISGLHLQGTSLVEGMALDLNHFDTRCNVRAYFEIESQKKAVKCADIIVMLGLNDCATKLPLTKLVMSEQARVIKMAEMCSKYAPKALLLVAVSPISVFLPTVAEVYRTTDWYHPARILGSAALPQVKANAIAGHYQGLDPHTVHVPIIGGPDIDCALPLFSKTSPAEIPLKDGEKLVEIFKEEVECPVMHQAVGLNRTISEMARGLNGDGRANVGAFVRTKLISTCKHLVCTVKIGKSGVVHNYGLQKLYKHELLLFEEICLELKEKEKMAFELVNRENKDCLPEFMIREIEQQKAEKLGIIR